MLKSLAKLSWFQARSLYCSIDLVVRKLLSILRYAMIISVQKLTEVVKTNLTGFLRMQRHNRKILKRILKRQLKCTGIDQKRLTD